MLMVLLHLCKITSSNSSPVHKVKKESAIFLVAYASPYAGASQKNTFGTGKVYEIYHAETILRIS